MIASVKYAATEAASEIRVKPIFTILAMFFGYLIWAGMPASLWLNVRSVAVFNAVEGTSPKMQVDRHIQREFEGVWRVEVERANPDRSYTMVKIITGSAHYNTDARLPADLDLDWWTYPELVRLSPGYYRIETCWTIKLMILADRETCVKSNVFHIMPSPS